MRIGELAERVGVSTRALRYYENQGLLSSSRTSGGQRVYAPAAADRVRLIRELYTAGLSSTLIADLLPAIDDKHIGPALLARLLEERVRTATKVAELQAAELRLDTLIRLATSGGNGVCPTTLDQTHGENTAA
ncbi:MerR family transcriptional regulator [Streptomyces coelicoflavus]|uniref:MerR family transcriptional regulator n=1 Tax=Streptomyces coelicoflavus TaxID=285562 RepID=UPI0036BB56E5